MIPHPLLSTMLILGASLLAATPSEARSALLHEGRRPPLFSLPDVGGKTVSLQSFLGPRRVVLLFGPSEAYLRTAQSERAQFEDRDLTVLAILPALAPQVKGTTAGPVHVLRDTAGRIAQEYGAVDGRPVFYLIGKDGHIALARHDYPTTQELFGVIDAMPMRRQEMRERHR